MNSNPKRLNPKIELVARPERVSRGLRALAIGAVLLATAISCTVLVLNLVGCDTVAAHADLTPQQQLDEAKNTWTGVLTALSDAREGGALTAEEWLATKPARHAGRDAIAAMDEYLAMHPEGGDPLDVSMRVLFSVMSSLQTTLDEIER